MEIYLATSLENRGWHLTCAAIQNRLVSFKSFKAAMRNNSGLLITYVQDGRFPPRPISMVNQEEKE